MSRPVVGPWRMLGDAVWELGEGVRAVDDALVAVDLLAGRLYHIDPHSGAVQLRASLDRPLGAVAPVEGDADWIAAVDTGIALLRGDAITWLARPEDGASAPMRMNDAVCDPSGRFWAGSMAFDTSAASGSLYRVDTDLSVHRVMDDLTIPNGPAFDVTGEVLYVADSGRGVIYRCDVAADGSLGRREEFATVDASPDGMTVDADGCLWSAVWGAAAVHRYTPSGALVDVFEVPASQPTSVAIATGRVVVTSATYGLATPTTADGRLFVAECAVAGLPTSPFRLHGQA